MWLHRIHYQCTPFPVSPRTTSNAAVVDRYRDNMAYPEPTPPLNPKQSIEFFESLEDFKLSEKQRDFLKDSREFYNEKKPKE